MVHFTPPAAHDPTDADSIDDSRHLRAFLFVLRKAHAELVGHEMAHARVLDVLTKGDARRYFAEILPLLQAERLRRRLLRKRAAPPA